MAKLVAMDGNSAVAHVAHATNEVIAIYPITPSSNMGEISDLKSAKGEKNIWGNTPIVSELQSEGGASGTVHGALSAGALTTTFTASQGLLLMIPNMYKISGELTPTVFHVSARAIATHALSIFGDHSDVMAVRQTGWAMLASANPQEAMDFALISQAATLEARVPFLHFFDGFRTSHELNMVDPLTKEQMLEMLDADLIAKHRTTALNPEHPTIRGTAQNPDVYFQGREAVNKFFTATPAIVKKYMEKFEKVAGRKYDLFEYVGDADADKLVIIMASGADVAETAVECLKGSKVGVLKVRLFRPFSIEHFVNAIPKTVKKIAVMDRTKEPGALGEPLFLDVCSAFLTEEGRKAFPVTPIIVGGRYGIGSKEFTPGMVKAVFDNLAKDQPKKSFVVGIIDDLTDSSLPNSIDCDSLGTSDTFGAMFFGLGSDGTVGANKNTMKIISEKSDNYSQGYFVYDSKKAGSMTTSHIRFGKKVIKAPYLIEKADFIACHMFSFLEKYDVLSKLKIGGTFLLNAPYPADQVWDHIPAEVQQQIIDKNAKFYAIDASEIALKTGMGARTNTIMQTAFFAISDVIETAKAIEAIKEAIKKTYSKKGEEIVNKNYAAVDAALDGLKEVKYDKKVTSKLNVKPSVPSSAPKMVKEVLGEMIAFRGDSLPTSAMPEGGIFPTATTQYEKRNIALLCPQWDPEVCIQCGICSLVCPHAAIRMKAYSADQLDNAPKTFKSADGKADLAGNKVTIQVAVEDCTGCGACVFNCPAKNKTNPERKAINMTHQLPLRDTEIDNFAFFLGLKSAEVKTKKESIKGSQLQTPLFEFSGACAGCGETPYVKLLTQLHGDHITIANATGCSSIYGGNLPTTPYCKRDDGKGPAWANSLFEDNAEFGLGIRLAYDQLKSDAEALLKDVAANVKEVEPLAKEILEAKQVSTQDVDAQRARVAALKEVLAKQKCAHCARLASIADYLIKKSVWILGGDGWAYDIGYGGLDHVLASGKNVKVLVMDTEVYSNTGGQMSKATPMGAVAQFAAGGKTQPKKDLGMISMTYGNIYVAQISMGANMYQAVQALAEAEAYDGPAIVIAYAHCIAHGIDMSKGMGEGKKAVQSGRWQLYRFNPDLKAQGKNPLTLDSGAPTIDVADFMGGENRFKTLAKANPEVAAKLLNLAKAEYDWRRSVYEQLANFKCDVKKAD
ncbi:Pyruvate:ferredoxin oxidoreductase [Elusimicrobium minutum Pei191]|uniref:Pyruvate:ferredoxin oxidoreductase n=1 Tax=Elusimicrobium minutum (strain Pei191) TaxID=445932 RepID=B2KCW5_ELUMP|nr:pyruvate:ferredoxin (flavodoxin) oxidoreductase [Elusimicrobium minutum]ACC98361.1 Pyruvate:ferredoxin oxidoreductase [Elusimicrobium minutum Pei191]